MRISDWSSDVCSSDLFAHDMHSGRHPYMYVRKLGFFEIAGDVKAVKVYKRHDRLAGCGVGPWPECEVGDDAIDRSANLSAFQVDTGQIPVGKRLGVAGASFLRRRVAGGSGGRTYGHQTLM